MPRRVPDVATGVPSPAARTLAAFTVAALFVTGASCGGANSSDVAERQVPEDFERFVSEEKHYAIAYPEEWEAKEDFSKLAGVSADQFIADEVDGFSVNVAVTTETLPRRMDTEGYLEGVEKSYLSGIDHAVEREVSIGDSTGIVVTYTAPFLSTMIDYSQALYVDGRQAWVITLGVPEGERSDYEEVFAVMLSSFELLD